MPTLWQAEGMITLARKLGTTTHVSPLLRKARALGLHSISDFEALAVARGCHYYAPEQASDTHIAQPSREVFSDEELAIALLHPCLPYDPQRIRFGAAMAASSRVNASKLAWLARLERTAAVLRQITEAGKKIEPANRFWVDLLALLPSTPDVASGVLPHPTRYVAMTGFTSRGRETVTRWVRPHVEVSCG
jgi:hypothetical protein